MNKDSKSPPIDLRFNVCENMQSQGNNAIKITTTERNASFNTSVLNGSVFGASPLNKLSIVPPFEL